MVSYLPLWKTLLDKNMKKMQLRDMVGFSNGTLSRLSKNEYVELKLLDKICRSLECRIEDVVEILPDKE